MSVSTRSAKYNKDFTKVDSLISMTTFSSTSQGKDYASSSLRCTKQQAKHLDSDQITTLQQKHVVNTTSSNPIHSKKSTAATSVIISPPLSPSKTNTRSPLPSTTLTDTLRSRSLSSKSVSTPSSTNISHPPIQREPIVSTKSSVFIDTNHHLITCASSSFDLSMISPLPTPQKGSCSNNSIYSSIISPILDASGPLSSTLIHHDANKTFDKRSSSQKSISSPCTSSPLSSETFILQQPPRPSSSPANSFSSVHDQALPSQLNASTDDYRNITEDNEELQNLSFMPDLQYEDYLRGEIKFGETTKNKPMIFMKNYSYLYMSTAPTLGTAGYRCARKDLNCPTTIHIDTVNNQYQWWNGKRHIHPPDSSEQRRREIISIIKKRVVNEHRPVCCIVEEEYAKAKLTTEEQVIFKNPKELESGLLKSRRKMYPPLPSDQYFTLPDFLLTTIDSSPFLVSDQIGDELGGRLLIFSSKNQMDLLLQSDILMADGTFRSCPRLFEQIYVIMAVKDSKSYPVLFALTSNRKEETYIAILNVIQEEARRRGVSFAPRLFINDFEHAWINAVKKTLITTSISGCWFHHVQCIYRWIQSNGLLKSYEEHEDKRQILRSFMALSLLPKNRVMEGFFILKERAAKYNELHQFIVYFKRQWLQTFKPDLWCVGSSNFRTNNSIESNNHRLNARIVQRHPNIWRFLNQLRNEEATINQKMLKANLALTTPSNHQPTSKKRAAKKTMQIMHLHKLLQEQRRTLQDVITSLSYLIGGSVSKVGKSKKGRTEG